MCVWTWLKTFYARSLLQPVRRRFKTFLLLICTSTLFLATVMVLSQSTPYQFPTCNITSLTDDVIGYETVHKSEVLGPIKPKQLEDLCQSKTTWYRRLPIANMKSDLREWSSSKSVDCPRFCLQKERVHRRTMVVLSCDGNRTQISSQYTSSADEVFSVAFGDSCLGDIIDRCSKGDKPVPNVVHYIWYGKKEFEFVHFLSFISVVRYMRPCLILVHGDYIPYGNFWNYLLQISPNIVHVRRDLVRTIYGNTLSYKEHGADVMRIEALQKYGGLYLDFDSVILRDVDALRIHDVTMGRENTNNLGNQFIMARKGAQFLQLWHEGYKHYKKRNWGWNSLYVPYNLAMANLNLIHIEGNRFTRPHFQDRNVIYNGNYDWSDNYAMHLYVRDYEGKLDIDFIRRLNTTMGTVSRHILFGNKELCSN